MKVSELFPSKYLRGADLAGHAASVIIEHVMLESFFDSETKETVKKPVLYFQGKQKGLVLSKTLAYKIADILQSEDMDSWKGKGFVIFTEQRSVYGQIKEVFSARAKEPPSAAAPGQQ